MAVQLIQIYLAKQKNKAQRWPETTSEYRPAVLYDADLWTDTWATHRPSASISSHVTEDLEACWVMCGEHGVDTIFSLPAGVDVTAVPGPGTWQKIGHASVIKPHYAEFCEKPVQGTVWKKRKLPDLKSVILHMLSKQWHVSFTLLESLWGNRCETILGLIRAGWRVENVLLMRSFFYPLHRRSPWAGRCAPEPSADLPWDGSWCFRFPSAWSWARRSQSSPPSPC